MKNVTHTNVTQYVPRIVYTFFFVKCMMFICFENILNISDKRFINVTGRKVTFLKIKMPGRTKKWFSQ